MRAFSGLATGSISRADVRRRGGIAEKGASLGPPSGTERARGRGAASFVPSSLALARCAS